MNNIGHTKAQVIAVAFAVVVGAAVGVWLPSGNAAVGDTAPAEGMQVRLIERPLSEGSAVLAGNRSEYLDTYLRIHAGVRADATLGVPGDGMSAGAVARQASVCGGEDGERAFPRVEGISRI